MHHQIDLVLCNYKILKKMKKVYLTPEMEKFNFEIPNLLQTEADGSQIGTGGEGNPGDSGD